MKPLTKTTQKTKRPEAAPRSSEDEKKEAAQNDAKCCAKKSKTAVGCHD